MNAKDLEELAGRCEQAVGPDRELDVAVWLAVEPGATRDQWSYTHKATGKECEVDETRNAERRLITVPAYSASIDAALSLVPEGWRKGFEDCGAFDGITTGCEAWCWPFESGFDPDWQNGHEGYRSAPDGFRAFAATPALALCAAALRARTSQ